MLSIIVAIDEHYAIGRNNDLLCHLPNDLKHFKTITGGHPVIMGKKTYLSLPRRPLPNRRNIIVSRTMQQEEGIEIVTTPEAALHLIDSEQETFIIGGGSIYRQLLPLADKLYITRIHHTWNEADTFFPEIDPALWKKTACERHEADERHTYAYSFEEWERR